VQVAIGRTLAAAREKAGLSVEEVAAATRIRRTLVANIESDDFSGCGGDFYARGHLRTIAATVGLDPAPLLAEFDAGRPDTAPPRASAVFESETAARPPRSGPNWSVVMALALVLVLGYGITSVLTGGPDRRASDGVTGAGRGTGSATAGVSPSSSPSPAPTNSAVARAPRDKVTVVLRARGTSWVRVTNASGRELFQGLVADRSVTFTDRSLVRLVIGNAGAVSLTVNGRPLGAPGKAGQVARVQFTPLDPAAG